MKIDYDACIFYVTIVANQKTARAIERTKPEKRSTRFYQMRPASKSETTTLGVPDFYRPVFGSYELGITVCI